MNVAPLLNITPASLSTPRANPDRQTKLRGVDPATSNKEYSDEVREFLKAADKYRSENGRPFVSLSEAFDILKELGYHKLGISS